MGDVADSILRGLEEAVGFARGENTGARVRWPGDPDAVDVRAIRDKLGLTQAEFAEEFGFSLGAVRHWEQGRRRPARAARLLLLMLDRHPDVVREVVEASSAPAA